MKYYGASSAMVSHTSVDDFIKFDNNCVLYPVFRDLLSIAEYSPEHKFKELDVRCTITEMFVTNLQHFHVYL